MAISWRVALFCALGLFLLFLFPQPVTVTLWLMFVATVTLIDVALAVDPREFSYSRSVASPIRADESTISKVTVTSSQRRGARIVLRDAWEPSLRPTPYSHSGMISAEAPFRVETRLTPERRGSRLGRLVTVRVWGPLGLGARQISVDVPASLDVLPEFRSRRLLPSRVARLQEAEGSTAVILRGPGTEFDSLRSYVRGDDPRDIDWKASARSKDLVVRTWQPERDRHVLLVVDTGRSSALLLGAPDYQASDADPDLLDLGSVPRLDAQIETALLMAGLADRAGDNVHVLALDRQVHTRISKHKGADLLHTMARGFRDISPSVEPTDWILAQAEINRTLRHRSLVILLTELPQAGHDPEFREIVARLSKTHTVMVASALDPTLEIIGGRRQTLDEISEAAAAGTEILLSDQGERDLQRAGAYTVCVDAGLLAARTADHYIDLKKRGIL